VYGRGSRGAILTWQAGRGLATTGLLGDADARDQTGGYCKSLADRRRAVRGAPGMEEISLRNDGGGTEVRSGRSHKWRYHP
jgi:hypothetical protein